MKLPYIAFILIVLLAAGCGQGSAATTTPADIHIAFLVEPDPPSVGESTLVFRLTRADGSAIEGATLSAQGNMDHAGMDAVEGRAETSSGGEYRVPFQWTMGGGWQVAVTVALPNGERATETFTVDVSAVSQQSIINQHDEAETNMSDMEMPTSTAGQ